ncbi:MAG: fimbrillin family protein [Dysgonamonadaceae bacterium]|jgi:hypothetical protein|nr:fimbrillin family protein [Dysgonamonadaceae bacterium]
MTTTKQILTVALIAAIGFTACSKSNVDENEKVTIIATVSGMGAQTKSLDGTGAGTLNGEVIRLDYTGGTSSGSTNFTIGTTTLYWDELIAAHGNPPFNFSAFHPAISAAVHTSGFNVVTETNPDLLYASVSGINRSDKVNLVFDHIMHKLVINLTSNNNYYTTAQLNAATITLKNLKSTAAVSANGVVNLNNASGSNAYPEKTGTNNFFIVAPQTLTEGTDFLEVLIDGKAFVRKVCSEVTALESGKVLTLNLSVGRDQLTLNGQNVNQWGSQGTITEDLFPN